MLNHPDVMWRYADTLARQAEIDGHRCCFTTSMILGALAGPIPTRRQLRILGFRDR